MLPSQYLSQMTSLYLTRILHWITNGTAIRLQSRLLACLFLMSLWLAPSSTSAQESNRALQLLERPSQQTSSTLTSANNQIELSQPLPGIPNSPPIQEALIVAPQDDAVINMTEQGAIDLQGLVRWACELQGYELVIDNQQFQDAKNKVIFFSKVKTNQSTAMLLVQEVLRANGFALVDAQVTGWKRVANLPDVAPFTQVIPAEDVAQKDFEYVTAVFQLVHISPENAKSYLQSLLQVGPGNQNRGDAFKTVGTTQLLIVTEMAKNIRRIQSILNQVDVPQDEIKVSFYKVKNLEAKELESQIISLLAAQGVVGSQSVQGDVAPTAPPSGALLAYEVNISSDVRTNRLILVGKAQKIVEIMKLIEGLDVPLDTDLRTYQFQHVSATRIDELMRQSLAGVNEAISRIYQSTVDSQTNQLIVTTREEIHGQIFALKSQLDRPKTTSPEQSPMHFYKLKNVKAADIVGTLQSIERKVRPSSSPRRQPNNGINARDGFSVNGPNFFDENFSEGPPLQPPSSSTFSGNNRRSNDLANDPQYYGGQSQFESPSLNSLAQIVSDMDTPTKIVPGDAQITIDEGTNTLIVVADPEVQALYAQLIQRLDVRRPQVMVEAHIVNITGTDDLNLGVEISGGDREGDSKLFSFTSFGLSEVDPTNGSLKIIPGAGFNGTLIDPKTADIVIKALASHSRSRVISSPKIVVDDNANGLLSSVAEEPFASVNATNTVSTTSFGGFAQAGTTINVTPHISEADYLNLEFDILVNSFTGAGASGLPPPRNTDQVVSTVTIPDGYTVIVGGLNRKRVSSEIKGLPFIERIPVLRRLASSESNSSSEGMIFVFLRPTILRDDQFRDLIYLSSEDIPKAQIEGDFPCSSPQLIR